MNYFTRVMTIAVMVTLAVLVSGDFSSVSAVGPAATGVVAKADTAEIVALNPAGMTRLKKPSWYGNPMVMYTKNTTEVTVQGVPGKREIDDDSFLFLPGLYYVRPINDKWTVGIGPNAGTGFGTTYGDEWVGRYLLDEWSLFFAGIAPSAAYRVNDKLSIGGSVSVNYSNFTLNKAVFNGLNEPDGEFEIEADGWAVGVILGVLYEFTDNTRAGLSYRSELEASNEGDPDFSDLSPARRNILEQAGILNQEISVDTNQPQALLAGFFHDFDNGWTMTVDAAWIDFSEWNIDNVTIGNTVIAKDGTEYQDIWACSVGATYDWKPKWNLRGGLAYVSSGLEDEDRTLFTRYDDMWGVGFGVKHTFGGQRSLAVDITYFQFGDGEVVIENAQLGNNVIGDITGEYDEHYGILFSISITR